MNKEKKSIATEKRHSSFINKTLAVQYINITYFKKRKVFQKLINVNKVSFCVI